LHLNYTFKNDIGLLFMFVNKIVTMTTENEILNDLPETETTVSEVETNTANWIKPKMTLSFSEKNATRVQSFVNGLQDSKRVNNISKLFMLLLETAEKQAETESVQFTKMEKQAETISKQAETIAQLEAQLKHAEANRKQTEYRTETKGAPAVNQQKTNNKPAETTKSGYANFWQ